MSVFMLLLVVCVTTQKHNQNTNAPAKDVRVAALQPHDRRARRGKLEQQLVDLPLGSRVVASRLADVHEHGAAVHQAQHVVRHQAVVQHDVGAAHELQRAQRQQPRVAGPGADEVDAAGAGGRLLLLLGVACGV